MTENETPQEAPQEEQNPAEENEFASFDQFLSDLPEEEWDGVDPSQSITIRTSAGQSFIIPVEGPIAIQDAIQSAELTTSPSIQYWADGVVVDPDFVVAPGATITTVGLVKGG